MLTARINIVLVVALGAVFLALFSETLWTTFRICYEDPDYSHGLLLPLLTIYFFWSDRDIFQQRLIRAAKEYPLSKQRFSVFGLITLIVGMLIYALGIISDLLFFRWFALFVVLTGIFYLSVGRKASEILLPPLLLNFMAKPLPDSLVPRLFAPFQHLAAQASATVLEALNVPVYLSGNIIEIPGMQLMVEEACSGLRSMMALLTVALIVLMSVEMRFFAKVIVFFFALFTAIALNVVRVAATGMMAHFIDPSTATGFFHTFSGMVVFVAGLVIVYSFGQLISRVTSRRGNQT